MSNNGLGNVSYLLLGLGLKGLPKIVLLLFGGRQGVLFFCGMQLIHYGSHQNVAIPVVRLEDYKQKRENDDYTNDDYSYHGSWACEHNKQGMFY